MGSVFPRTYVQGRWFLRRATGRETRNWRRTRVFEYSPGLSQVWNYPADPDAIRPVFTFPEKIWALIKFSERKT